MTLPSTSQGDLNRRGIFAMIISQALFSSSDAMVKLASGTLPAGELMAFRGIMGLVLLMAIIHYRGEIQLWVHCFRPIILLRAALEAAITVSFINAVSQMPLGNFTAIAQVSPLLIVVMAVVLFKTPIGLRRLLTLCVGFVGVLCVAQPESDGFSDATLYAILCASLVALRDIITRFIPAPTPTLYAALMSGLSTSIFGGFLMLSETAVMPAAANWLELALSAIAVSIGNIFIVIANRKSDLSQVAPFRYTSLLFSLSIGFLIWGTLPNLLAMIGIALIVASGLYVLYLERIKQQILARASLPEVTTI